MVQLKAMLFHRQTWNFPLCLTAAHFFCASCDYLHTCDGQEIQLSGKHSTDGSCGVMLQPFFGCSLTSELGTFINADMQLTSFKKHGSRVFSDKIHLPPAIKRNWSVFMKLNVQYNTKMYWPWKLFDYCLIDKKV